MATYSSILAWKIPWREELGGLRSVGSQRVGHSFVTEHIGTHRAYYAHGNGSQNSSKVKKIKSGNIIYQNVKNIIYQNVKGVSENNIFERIVANNKKSFLEQKGKENLLPPTPYAQRKPQRTNKYNTLFSFVHFALIS